MKREKLNSGPITLLCVGILCMVGCASVTTTVSGPDSQTAATASAESTQESESSPSIAPDLPEPEEEIQYANFPEDILNRVIMAELAGQRGFRQQSLIEYSELARETHDLNIIKRTSRIAAYLRNSPISIEMADLWLEQQPDSPEALQTLAYQMISMKRYREALNHMTRLLALDRIVDFRLITSQTTGDADIAFILDALIADFKDLHEQYPENQSVHLGLAHLYQQNDQIQEAYDEVRELAVEMNDAPEIVILETELLEMLGEENKAQRRLQQSLQTNPENKRLRFLYAQKLIDEQKYEEAREQFGIIVEQYPDDYDMLYSLALISMEVKLYNDAKRYFQRLVDNSQRLNDAHFYLAFISEQEDAPQQAIEYYLQIKSGSNYLQAQRNVTELMVQQGRYPEARERLQTIRYTNPDYNIALLTMEANVLMDLDYLEEAGVILNSSIGAFPNNVPLLFLRSVLSQDLNDLELMEQDLRKIIKLNPNSPVAYNSLGYTLADRTDRYEEAYNLIKIAIELAPNDPAIIDSLGWVQYRLGLYEEARENLDRAFELFPDHEVAAHLGEVLWVLGDRDGANRIWQNALRLQPDSEHIKNAIDRLTSDPSI